MRIPRRQLLIAAGAWLTARVRAGDPAGAATSSSSAGLEALLAGVSGLLAARAGDFIAGTDAHWADRKQRRAVTPAPVPVLRELPACLAAAPGFSRALVQDLVRAAPAMSWRRSYAQPDVSARFLDNYGWSELAGLSGPVPSTTLAVGALLLGPGIEYPAHAHEALELYLPLSGRAQWWTPRRGWHAVEPGQPVRHARHETHAMRTGAAPLLALYAWRSADLAQHAELVARPRGAAALRAESNQPAVR